MIIECIHHGLKPGDYFLWKNRYWIVRNPMNQNSFTAIKVRWYHLLGKWLKRQIDAIGKFFGTYA